MALTVVDNAGITRVKAIPVARLEFAALWGIGIPPVLDVALSDDSFAASRCIGGPEGDVRLVPDLERLTVLAGHPGWAWAPADRYDQQGQPYMACQRLFARRMVERAAVRGICLRMGFETEWTVLRGGEYACSGPAFGMARLAELSDYLDALMRVLVAQGVEVLQIHPEYSRGQFEVSVAPSDPVGAADLVVLVRETVRAVSLRHGLTPLFGPVVKVADVGQGGHLHLSLWRDGRNLCRDGGGPFGMTADCEAFLAGVLDGLPALLAIGAPTAASYLRLVPSRWAGGFQCWGLENREAAIRFIMGARDAPDGANAEVKCFDAAANPYLLTGAVIAAGMAGMEAGGRLPGPVSGDPALWPVSGSGSGERAEGGGAGCMPGRGPVRGLASGGGGCAAGGHGPVTRTGAAPVRLPRSLPEALEHFSRSGVLREALGEPLFEAIVAVRTAEQELFTGMSAQEIADATRGRY